MPCFQALDTRRDEALNRLVTERAKSSEGLRAKASALRLPSVSEAYENEGAVAQSLARDLLGATDDMLFPGRDPMLAVLAEQERLNAAVRAGDLAGFPEGNPTAAQEALSSAAIRHWREVVLKTVPRTAEGCQALARATIAHHRLWACTMDDGEGAAAFNLIARSPLI